MSNPSTVAAEVAKSDKGKTIAMPVEVFDEIVAERDALRAENTKLRHDYEVELVLRENAWRCIRLIGRRLGLVERENDAAWQARIEDAVPPLVTERDALRKELDLKRVEVDRLAADSASLTEVQLVMPKEFETTDHTDAQVVAILAERAAAGRTITDEQETAAQDIIMQRLNDLQERGIIVSFCDDHDREHIAAGDHGEYCHDCAADGASGELCVLGSDSEAIDLVEKIVKALGMVKA